MMVSFDFVLDLSSNVAAKESFNYSKKTLVFHLIIFKINSYLRIALISLHE